MSLYGTITEYLKIPSIQIALVCFTAITVRFFISRRRRNNEEEIVERVVLPSMEKRDFTLEELKPFNGVDDARILIAVNGKIFDVTRGATHYGPDGPYNVFAGRDASRGLATFSIDSTNIRDTYDDLSDLNSMQMESVLEWEMQFTEKYDYIGKLLKPGEKHCNYKAEESEDETKNEKSKKSD